ncbi:TPA: hypothetical protein NH715_003693 [Pseudomonas aeruginosa]|nr:hypothetical protein [Pseudomonas aeruginosa]
MPRYVGHPDGTGIVDTALTYYEHHRQVWRQGLQRCDQVGNVNGHGLFGLQFAVEGVKEIVDGAGRSCVVVAVARQLDQTADVLQCHGQSI